MPAKNDGLILRAELLGLFNSLSAERIIYVAAPAGYGKTVAVRQWLDGDIRPKAIISLDYYDNNPRRFCERFCAALRICQPKNAVMSQIASHAAFGGAPEEFTARAIAALAKTGPSVLVIDNLYIITDEQVLRLMLLFLLQLPQNFQLVLISRYDLPPAFSSLWANRPLAQVTAEQLLFSKEEVALLCEKRGKAIMAAQAEEIYSFTGGWAIGVGALLLSGEKAPAENLDILEQFLRQNVWERWDEKTREFLLRTSAARELSPALCAFLTGEPDCGELLNQLMRDGAFIYQSSDGVYHYYHLFQTFLRNMLKERGEDFIRLCWQKAGEWYLAQNDFFNALDYFVKCENYDGVAKCFSLLVAAGHEYFQIEKMISVAHLAIIDEAAKKFPFIYATLAWAAFNEGRVDDMTRYADLYYLNQHKIVQIDPRLQFNIVLVRLIDFRLSLSELMQTPGKALVNFTSGDLNAMGVSLSIINQNMPFLHRGTRDFSPCAVGDTEANVASVKASFGGLFGNAATLLAECLAAGLLYEQGHLEQAYGHALAANAEVNNSSAPEAIFCALSVLIHILDARGQEDEAAQMLKKLSLMIEHNIAYYLSPNLSALEVRRQLKQGDMAVARQWLLLHGALYDKVTLHGIYQTITACRAYISVGECDSAIILLKKVLKLAELYGRSLDIIEAKILLSIAYWHKQPGFKEDSIRHFAAAVSLAQGFGYTQIFVNHGAELLGQIQSLLKKTAPGSGADMAIFNFLHRLQEKIGEDQDGSPANQHYGKLAYYTDKQKTVMKLLCEGKAYKEIAKEMGIKLPTLRSHIALIYSKLDVTSETEAIRKIKAAGILSEK